MEQPSVCLTPTPLTIFYFHNAHHHLSERYALYSVTRFCAGGGTRPPVRTHPDPVQGQHAHSRLPVQVRQDHAPGQGLFGSPQRTAHRAPAAGGGRTERRRAQGQGGHEDHRRCRQLRYRHRHSELHLRAHA